MVEDESEIFEEMDETRRQSGGHSCCTVWTLGLLLLGVLSLGLFALFAH